MSDVFLLTGCASGIGRHLTRALSTLGHQVVATDINEAGLTAAAAAFGRLDVLLNIAGYLLPGWCWELDAAQLDRHLDINVKGVMHGVTVLGKYFVRKGKGHIINRGFSEGYAVAVLLSVLIAAFAWSEWRAVKGTVGELVGLRPAPAPLPAGAR